MTMPMLMLSPTLLPPLPLRQPALRGAQRRHARPLPVSQQCHRPRMTLLWTLSWLSSHIAPVLITPMAVMVRETTLPLISIHSTRSTMQTWMCLPMPLTMLRRQGVLCLLSNHVTLCRMLQSRGMRHPFLLWLIQSTLHHRHRHSIPSQMRCAETD
jgi:hypothetical protein